MKSAEGIAFSRRWGLTGSFRTAAVLGGCSQHLREVRPGARPAGADRRLRRLLIDGYLVEEWVQRSEQGPPDQFFGNPRNERTRQFLSAVLQAGIKV